MSFLPLAACTALSGTMRASPQRGGVHVSSCLILLILLSKVNGVVTKFWDTKNKGSSLHCLRDYFKPLRHESNKFCMLRKMSR